MALAIQGLAALTGRLALTIRALWSRSLTSASSSESPLMTIMPLPGPGAASSSCGDSDTDIEAGSRATQT
eukprot:1246816-Rhodomonas_salina.2